MTDPSPTIRVAPDWQPRPVVVTGPWIAPEILETAVNWRAEIVVGEVVAVYSLLFGGAVGLLWPRLAPHIQLVAAINGSEAATKALLGDDLWLALLGIIAGVVSVAVLALTARDAGDGPGGAIGLAVGGVLGSLVAAHVGHLVQQPHITSALRSSFPGITHHSMETILGYFDFKVRAKAVLVAWPLAAVIVHAATVALRFGRAGARRARHAA